jgi:hypothetical protein
MRDKNKTHDKLVQTSKYPGLAEIAYHLNRIDKLQGEQLKVCKIVEDIVETMTGQPGQDPVYTEREAEERRAALNPRGVDAFLSGLGRGVWHPAKRIPLPKYAISTFNRWARKNPITLRVWIDESKKRTPKIVAGIDPATQSDAPLLFLWTQYFQNEGWKRLKRCPTCRLWFVDETKNRIKVFCKDNPCKWRFWNRLKRWESGHKGQKEPKRKGASKSR